MIFDPNESYYFEDWSFTFDKSRKYLSVGNEVAKVAELIEFETFPDLIDRLKEIIKNDNIIDQFFEVATEYNFIHQPLSTNQIQNIVS